LREKIEREIGNGEAPSELQMRMEIMGLSPWSIAGFALALTLFSLNQALGTGWASQKLGLDGGSIVAGDGTIVIDAQALFTDQDDEFRFAAGRDLDARLQRRIAEFQQLQTQ